MYGVHKVMLDGVSEVLKYDTGFYVKRWFKASVWVGFLSWWQSYKYKGQEHTSLTTKSP